MWDERYNTEDYVYGTTPNNFLQENINKLPKGRILSLAEGEGRNAVFLAKQGYNVTAVDSSIIGLNKAQQLAQANNVTINCIHADLAEFTMIENQWDAIISIFCPLPSHIRKELYKKVTQGLNRGGVFLLEAYTPKQVNYETGGGKNPDTMQTKKSLSDELAQLDFLHLIELERDIKEGIYHTGIGAVVQAIAIKK
ncbi:MAG: class I SAM-dependent methyltransferase [Methylococcaceae bacterium]